MTGTSHEHDIDLVVSVDGGWCNVTKFVGAQLRRTLYRVKICECYKVPDVRS